MEKGGIPERTQEKSQRREKASCVQETSNISEARGNQRIWGGEQSKVTKGVIPVQNMRNLQLSLAVHPRM